MCWATEGKQRVGQSTKGGPTEAGSPCRCQMTWTVPFRTVEYAKTDDRVPLCYQRISRP